MPAPQSARMALKAATAEDHDKVDRAFSRFALADRRDYGRFLQAHAAAFLPLEAALAASGPERVLPDWEKRRRSDFLRDDLADLGLGPGHAGPAARFETEAEILGTVYVLEGSRLGGTLLVRSVPDAFPKRFLSSSDSTLWRTLIELLDSVLVTPDDRRLAMAAAKAAFARFEHSASTFQG